MIVVKLEIWPDGSRPGRIEVGAMTIVNVTPGDLATADYAVRFYRGSLVRTLDQVVKEAYQGDVIRDGVVKSFQRLKHSAWSLLGLASASVSLDDLVK